MEREIKLIGYIAAIFAGIGTVVLLFISKTGAVAFLSGALIILLHYEGIKGITAGISLREKRKKAMFLSLLLFILTMGVYVGAVFFLVRKDIHMVIYFLSGVLTLTLSAIIVIISLIIGRKKWKKNSG